MSLHMKKEELKLNHLATYVHSYIVCSIDLVLNYKMGAKTTDLVKLKHQGWE